MQSAIILDKLLAICLLATAWVEGPELSTSLKSVNSIIKKRTLPPRRYVKPSFTYLIEKKRDGGEFTQEEIRFIIDSVLDGEMPDYQLAALIMAIYFQSMSAQESAILTEEMMLVGETVDLSHIAKPKIDKYSTGGAGDKTSLVLVPLAMASGVVVRCVRCRAGVEISGARQVVGDPGFKARSLCSISRKARRVGRCDRRTEQGLPRDELLTNMRKRPAPSRAFRSSPVPSFPKLRRRRRLGSTSRGARLLHQGSNRPSSSPVR
jgi:hypothetical protein